MEVITEITRQVGDSARLRGIGAIPPKLPVNTPSCSTIYDTVIMYTCLGAFEFTAGVILEIKNGKLQSTVISK